MNTNNIGNAALVLFFSFLIAACSAIESAEESVADAEQGTVESATYSLTQDQALAVIKRSFAEGWPDKELSPLEDGRVGYQIRLWFAIDREHVSAEVVNVSQGRVKFRVINRGTAPARGVPARKELLELIEQEAARVSS